MKQHTLVSCLVFSLISGCSNATLAATPLQQEAVATTRISPRPTVTRSQPTVTASSTATPRPVLSPLPTPSTSILTPLTSSALITITDISASELSLQTDYFLPPFTIEETTDRSEDFCIGECFSITWRGRDDINVVTVTLVRVTDQKQADEVIADYYHAFQELQPTTYYQDERRWIRAPVENTRFAISGSRAVMWLTTSLDNIVVLLGLTWHPPVGAFDYNAYDNVSLLADLANRQIDKLKTLSVIP